MFKVSNRNTRKRCLLISKITLKTSERRHLTTSYLNYVLDSFSKNIYEFEIKSRFQVRRPVISIIVNPYMSLYEKREIISEIFDLSKFKISAFFYFCKNRPKNGQIFQLFTLYSKGCHFSITKLDILIFCNILHLEMDI